jgi:hypothetical protein
VGVGITDDIEMNQRKPIPTPVPTHPQPYTNQLSQELEGQKYERSLIVINVCIK